MSDLKPTGEQQQIIDAVAAGDSIKVDAVAGSGKTSTLNMAARAISGASGLYLVYNRAAADDARKKFPKNIEVKTTSALAYREFVNDYGERLPGSYVPSWEVAKMMRINRPLDLGGAIIIRPHAIAAHAAEAIRRFCYSSDSEISEKHVVDVPFGLNLAQEMFMKMEIAAWAQKMWNASVMVGSALPFTFDMAFKMYVSSEPFLSFDVIMLDEAQDSNAVVEQFIKGQYAQKVVVGDPAQQLYSWRGAVNIMDRFEGERLTLSQSWRFGEEIAEEADKWLAHTNTGITVKGNPGLDSVVTEKGIDEPDAILCRTNAGAMSHAMALIAQGKRVAVAGGTKELEKLSRAAFDLYEGRATNHPDLVAFNSWAELRDFTGEGAGSSLKAMVTLIDMHGAGAILDACRATVDETRGNPDVVVSTAHKSKGREWLKVKVAEDFSPPKPTINPLTGDAEPGLISSSEAMLGYVTVTRARQQLDRDGLAWIDDHPALVRNTKKILKEEEL